MPRPQSFVALPPMPMMKSRQPRSAAARMSSPRPYVVVWSGLRPSGGTIGRPAASAISMMAVFFAASQPKRLGAALPSGPVTSTRTISPARPSASASTVPSPPSASGKICAVLSGKTARMALATMAPASMDETLPLNESMAMTKCFGFMPFTFVQRIKAEPATRRKSRGWTRDRRRASLSSACGSRPADPCRRSS